MWGLGLQWSGELVSLKEVTEVFFEKFLFYKTQVSPLVSLKGIISFVIKNQ
jgi:hypothetical protein